MAAELSSRVFQIVSSQGAAVTVVFQNLTVQGGAATNGGALGGSAALGGGILIDGGQVTLSSVSVKSNRAGVAGATNTGAGGGLSGPGGANGAAGKSAQGGGIYVASGTVMMSNVQITNNSAYGGDGNAGPAGFVSVGNNHAGGGAGTAARPLAADFTLPADQRWLSARRSRRIKPLAAEAD